MHALHKQLIGIKWANQIDLVFHFTRLMLHVTIAKLWVSPRDTTQTLNFHNFTTWNNSSNYSSSFLQRKKSWDTALKCWPREKTPNPNLKIGAGICLDVWTGVCPIKISIKWQPVLWHLSSSLGHLIPQFAGIKVYHTETQRSKVGMSFWKFWPWFVFLNCTHTLCAYLRGLSIFIRDLLWLHI